jgi:1-aminocyclopropane-1-carboxylate deaminase/D-cysteine desulfhydrase-like pyridoxal-dependent ACC family enzyme
MMKDNLRSGALYVLLAVVAAFTFLALSDGLAPFKGGSLVRAASAKARVCTLADSAGTFAVYAQGTSGLGPQASVGLLTSDGAGNFAGTATASVNGNIFHNVAFNGTLTVNSDCTYSSTSTDQFGNVSHNFGVVINQGEETHAIRTDAGTTISVVFKRL